MPFKFFDIQECDKQMFWHEHSSFDRNNSRNQNNFRFFTKAKHLLLMLFCFTVIWLKTWLNKKKLYMFKCYQSNRFFQQVYSWNWLGALLFQRFYDWFINCFSFTSCIFNTHKKHQCRHFRCRQSISTDIIQHIFFSFHWVLFYLFIFGI